MPDELEQIRQLEERIAERRAKVKEQNVEMEQVIREAEERRERDKPAAE